MPNSKDFWNKTAPGYADAKIRDERAYEKKLMITQDLFPPDAEILEIACGTGTTALRHAPHVRHYLATDVSSKMLEIARAKAAEQRVTNVTFLEQDISAADWPPAQYDTVLAMSILHLLPDRPAALAKIHDTLKPGGRFISSTICLGNMGFYFPLLIGAMKLIGKAPNTVDSLTHDDLATAITTAGFTLETHHKMSKAKVAFIIAKKPE
ncbi:MAG: class I SAM-dependent methyltransferase [Pseudomonadota bacterium]